MYAEVERMRHNLVQQRAASGLGLPSKPSSAKHQAAAVAQEEAVGAQPQAGQSTDSMALVQSLRGDLQVRGKRTDGQPVREGSASSGMLLRLARCEVAPFKPASWSGQLRGASASAWIPTHAPAEHLFEALMFIAVFVPATYLGTAGPEGPAGDGGPRDQHPGSGPGAPGCSQQRQRAPVAYAPRLARPQRHRRQGEQAGGRRVRQAAQAAGLTGGAAAL